MNVQHHRNFNMKRIDLNPLGAIQTLKKGVAVVKEHCKYWLSAGTALGIVRDDGLIPWDTDIDIEIMEEDLTVYLMRDLTKAGFLLIRTQQEDGKYWQMAFLDQGTGFIFDIYTYQKEGVEYVNHNEHGQLRLPCTLIDNLETCRFEGEEFFVPGPVEAYLTHRYGMDWHTPKGSKDPWEKDANNIKK